MDNCLLIFVIERSIASNMSLMMSWDVVPGL
jgi:hypothetical protein